MVEIEHKFIIDPLIAPTYIKDVVDGRNSTDSLVSIQEIEQYYIVDQDNVNMRVRIVNRGKKDEEYILTIKESCPGHTRLEIERELSQHEADALIRLSKTSLTKTRYVISTKCGWCWEVDAFRGNLANRYYAEIELTSDDSIYTLLSCSDSMTLADGVEHSNAYLSALK